MMLEEIESLIEKQAQQEVLIKSLEARLDSACVRYDAACKVMKLELLAAKKRNEDAIKSIERMRQEIQELKSLNSSESSTGPVYTSDKSVMKIKQECYEPLPIPMIEPKHQEEFDLFLKSNRICILDLCSYYDIREELDGVCEQIHCNRHHTHIHSASLKLRHPYGYSKFAALHQASRAAHLFKDPNVVRKLIEAILNDNELFSEIAPPCE